MIRIAFYLLFAVLGIYVGWHFRIGDRNKVIMACLFAALMMLIAGALKNAGISW